jgi:hypothetical protein
MKETIVKSKSKSAKTAKKQVSKIDTNSIFELSSEDMLKLKNHPYLENFPESDENEYVALEENLLKNGMREPIIITTDFEILSGRSRMKCYNAHSENITPIFRYFKGNESLEEFILRDNIFRKQISNGGKAIIAVRTYQYIVEQRKINSTFKINGFEISDFAKSRDLVAKLFGISPTYVSYANSIVEKSPELAQAVLLKTLSLKDAYDICNGKSLESVNADSNDSIEKEFVNDSEETDETNKSQENEGTNENLTQSPTDQLSDLPKPDKTCSKATDSNTIPIDRKQIFEKKFRELKDLEIKFHSFITKTLKNSLVEQIFFDALTKEEEEKMKNTELSEDEKFDLFCDSFIETVNSHTPTLNLEKVVLNYSDIIDSVKKSRDGDKKLTFEDQLTLFKQKLGNGKIESEYLSEASLNFDNKLKLFIDPNQTIFGQLFSFIKECAELLNVEQNEGTK